MRFPVISKKNPLVLASASPRRKRLLKEIGLPFRSLACDIHEQRTGEDPPDITRFLAEKKAMTAYSRAKTKWVLGADTIVVLRDTILGKPIDHDEAMSMLRQTVRSQPISGRVNHLERQAVMRSRGSGHSWLGL